MKVNYYLIGGIIVALILAVLWFVVPREKFTAATPVLLTDAMSIGDPDVGPYAMENSDIHPSFSLNIDRLGYVANIQALQDGIAAGNTYTVKVSGAPSGLTYSFQLATVTTSGSPPNIATLANMAGSKSSATIFSGDKSLLFEVTPAPPAAHVTSSSAPPAAPTFAPNTPPATGSAPAMPAVPPATSTTPVPPAPTLAAASAPTPSSLAVVSPAAVTATPLLDTLTALSPPVGNTLSSARAPVQGPSPIHWTPIMNATIPGPNVSASANTQSATDKVYKSSLVPCTCPTYAMSCPVHAGSQAASHVPGQMTGVPGDTASALSKSEDQFNIMRPFNNTDDDVPGYLNTFSNFGS